MCDKCIHKAVCGKCRATGGNVRECEHFKEERRGKWNTCPNCGANMREGNPSVTCGDSSLYTREPLGAKESGDCHVAGAPRNDMEDGEGVHDGQGE